VCSIILNNPALCIIRNVIISAERTGLVCRENPQTSKTEACAPWYLVIVHSNLSTPLGLGSPKLQCSPNFPAPIAPIGVEDPFVGEMVANVALTVDHHALPIIPEYVGGVTFAGTLQSHPR